MADTTLIGIFQQLYDVGRAALFLQGTGAYPSETFAYWDGADPISLLHAGNTEGEIVPAANAEYSTLTLPENTGPAPIKKYLTGEAPTFEFGVFADLRTLRIFSPTGASTGGQMRQRRVKEHTIWVAPEQLFLKKNTDGTETEVEVDPIAGTKDGSPFEAADQALFDLSTFFWKVHFERAMTPYRHADGGKSLMQVTCHVLADFTKPDGNQLWTLGGDLDAAGISLGGESS